MIYDVIIIGSGLSALALSHYLPKNLNVVLVCKDAPWDCNTFYAQGGIALSRDKDDIKSHIRDTVKAGCGVGDEGAITYLCEHSKGAIDELIALGLEFDKDKEGNLAYTKEGGHSKNRILHCDGDATGRVIHSFLIQKLHHKILDNTAVTDLLVEDGVCYGVSVFDGKSQKNLYARNVVIASGGVGGLFLYNTNAHTVSGDLHGIVVEKGGILKDMEMLQFHPTVYVANSWARKLLLSEALRGEGAYVVDGDGERFLFRYHKDGELAPRDVVSRAIFEHSKEKNGSYLSFEALSRDFLEHRFPNIFKNLTELGFSLPKDKIPISPAFHYAMGGIKSDIEGRVYGVENLFVVGEAACNGLHGANRLASNSLLESLVFAKSCASLITDREVKKVKKIFPESNFVLVKSGDQKLKTELREVMWRDVGIVRRKKGLEEAMERVDSFLSKDIGRMLFLRLLCAREIVKAALNRDESIGAHYLKEGELDA